MHGDAPTCKSVEGGEDGKGEKQTQQGRGETHDRESVDVVSKLQIFVVHAVGVV